MPRATFDCFFLATFEQLFEKLRDTFWKISSNLWKALPHDTKALVSASFTSGDWGTREHARQARSTRERWWERASFFSPSNQLPTPLSRERVPQPRSQGSLLPTLRSERRVGRRELWERGCGSPRPATSPLLWITIDRRKQGIPTPFKADSLWNLLIQCCYIKEIGTCCHKSNISIVLVNNPDQLAGLIFGACYSLAGPEVMSVHICVSELHIVFSTQNSGNFGYKTNHCQAEWTISVHVDQSSHFGQSDRKYVPFHLTKLFSLVPPFYEQ